jgi:aminoglycoside phosphotransferase family enzyme/predicted kinase
MLAAMREPTFYPHRPPSVEVVETHISLVFLAGERAYKVKKAVALPFLDYRTLAQRRHFCHEEVRLNRRLAESVYLGVRSIVPGDGGFELAGADRDDALEYAVEMRRLDSERTLARIVERGEADTALVERVAARIADFHEQARQASTGYGGPADVKRRIDENFEALLPWVGTVESIDRGLDEFTFAALKRFSSSFLVGHSALIAARAAGGRVREGHGDLRGDHVVIEEAGVTVYDCVEFDERLRSLDVASDLAFLYMDLERLGAPELAAALADAYVERSGDAELPALLPFYACYRALVRAKVACLRAEQLDPSDRCRAASLDEARSLAALAHLMAWRARLPLVLVLCGVAASGKSSLAAELSRRSGLPHLSTDRVRKELAGVPLDERAPAEAYGDRLSLQTYHRLGQLAAAEARAGRGAIVDGTFTRRRYRQRLVQELEPTGVRLLFCECRAPATVLRERAAVRELGPELGSDATWNVVQSQIQGYERFDEIPARDHHVLRTDRPLAEALDQLEAFVSAAVDREPTRVS